MCDPVRLLRWFNKELADFAYIIALSVIGLRSHQFGCVKHGLLHSTSHKKSPHTGIVRLRALLREIEPALAADELLELRPANKLRALACGRPQTPSCCVPQRIL